jgi:hypothetical protein
MPRIRIREDEEKRRLVEEWDRSGLSAETFAGERKIHPMTLRSWGRAIRGPLPRGRRSRRRPVTRKMEFVEVSAPVPTEGAPERRIEVIMPSGVRLLMFVDWTPELVAEFAVLLEATQ